MDARVLRKRDLPGVVGRDNPFDVKPLGEEAPLCQAGRPCACRDGQHLGQEGAVRAEQPVGKRREEGPYAVGRNDAPGFRIQLEQPVADLKLAALHLPDHIRAELAAALPVVRERSVHDDAVEIAQREPDVFARADLGCVKRVQRPSGGGNRTQIPDVVGSRQDLERSRPRRSVVLRPVRHSDEVHALVVHSGRAERHVAGGKLDAVLVDVEAAEHIFDDAPMQRIALGSASPSAPAVFAAPATRALMV